MQFQKLSVVVSTVALLGATVACSSSAGQPSDPGSSGRSTTAIAATAAKPGSIAPVTVGGVTQTCTILSANMRLLTDAANGHTADLEQQLAKMRGLESGAPADIRSDITVVADFDEGVLNALKSGKSQHVAQTAELGAALAHTATWLATNCP